MSVGTMMKRNGHYTKPESEATVELDGHNLNVAIRRITPQMAATYLESNPANRKIRKRTAGKYADAMKLGHWRLNGEPIIFDSDGILRNGQHRLTACVDSGVPFYAVVVVGVSPDVFVTLDRPLLRSATDALQLHGEANAAKLGTLLSYMHKYERRELENTNAPAEPIVRMDVLERHPELRDYMAEHAHSTTVMAAHLAAFCHYVLARIDKPKADEFMRQVLTGANLNETDPAFVLRRVLLNFRMLSAGRRNNIRGYHVIALVFKAWQKFYAGVQIKSLSWRETEAYPYLER